MSNIQQITNVIHNILNANQSYENTNYTLEVNSNSATLADAGFGIPSRALMRVFRDVSIVHPNVQIEARGRTATFSI